MQSDDNLDFETLDPEEGCFSFPLFAADLNSESGKLRYQYDVPDDSVPIFHKEETDNTLSVQRLLWADGWLDKGAMSPTEATLVVLKFVFLSTPSSETTTRLENMKAALYFEDGNGKDPEVVAWAPFHQGERFNRVAVHHQNINSTKQAVDVGYQGSKIALERGREKSVSWDRTDFDEARVVQTFNKKGQPNGIKWWLKQNHFQNQGLVPEFWAAILVSRASSSTYTVKFTMEGRTSIYHNLKLRTKQAIGLRKDGSSFTMKPQQGKVAVCNMEGKDILKCVDLEHLDELVDPRTSTKLIVDWGPRYQDDPQGHNLSRGACTCGTNVARLAGLEGRMAQLEARLAAQDTIILQMQQAQLARDVQALAASMRQPT